ncbi:hypothetical protein CRM22_007426 [Opisthorchis felineus]|uniref:Cilia- and flagella-associated protein 251 n=1 Tax=Opisthorchis felineus TaxID=147828 RepID=A0A4S2LI49_OPIFE|nr:hypothetical protein CRM22_007426 [Opisthorchis felineus]
MELDKDLHPAAWNMPSNEDLTSQTKNKTSLFPEHSIEDESAAANPGNRPQTGEAYGRKWIRDDEEYFYTKLWVDEPTDLTLYPVWAFGFNHRVPLINLSRSASSVVCYASSHLVIIADLKNSRQRILRGHCNEITSLTSSADTRWLASGDRGPDNSIIIWDGKTGDAVRTMLSPHKMGVVAIQLTEDARYLATLSADKPIQEFSIWNWTTGSDKPLCNVFLHDNHNNQNRISFKLGSYFHVVTNSEQQVIFYNWNTSGEITAYAAPLSDEDFNKKIGSFVGSCSIPGTNTVVTATAQGLLVIWELDKVERKKDEPDSPYKKAIKLIQIHDKPITFITVTRCRLSNYSIVTGDAAGTIKFFDTNYRILFWYDNLNSGPIASISFAQRGILDGASKLLDSSEYPQRATIAGERFVVEDFMVTTHHAAMISVTVDGSFLKFIKRENHEEVTGLSTHPSMPHLATCSLTGLLKVFDYKRKKVIRMKNYGPDDPIQTCCYNATGMNLAVGFVSGHLRILDSITLNDVIPEPFTYGRGAITHVDFDPFNQYCAYADSAFTTTLVSASSVPDKAPWAHVGRIRVHYRKITDLLFYSTPRDKQSRLFSIGEDRTLVEYDIHAATKNDFPMLARYRIEQMFTPLCMSSLPPHYKESLILVSTGASKLKLFSTSSFNLRKLVAAYPTSIMFHKVKPLPSSESDSAHFLLCMSDERLSLVMLPLDGDPLKYTNIIAHPSGPRGTGKASALAVSHDGRYVFTAGGPDTCIHMWGVNTKILEDRVKNSCEVKQRFYDLLTPEFLNELKDYFYYSMLRTQGLKCMDTRRTSFTIPTSEISFVMRAIGYYPSEDDIENIINEVKYSKFAETGFYTDEVDLDTFIQMYCNYRPYHGTTYKEICDAFDRLCHVQDSDTGQSLYFRDPRESVQEMSKIPPEFLFGYMQSFGEALSEAEMLENLAVLLGAFHEGGRPEMSEPYKQDSLKLAVDLYLPMFLTPQTFVQRILGMRSCSATHIEGDYYGEKLRIGEETPSELPATSEDARNTKNVDAQTEA